MKRTHNIQALEQPYSPGLTLLLGAAAIILLVAGNASPQSQPGTQPGSEQQAKPYVGPSAETIKPYRPAGRDPFKKEVKPKPGKGKVSRVVGFPSLEVRRSEFRQKLDTARARELPEPDPVSQYLVSELDVTGIFRDRNGFGAFVRAQPTGTMFFVRRGSGVYNGEIVGIEDDSTDPSGSKVLFRELSFIEVNGKQSKQERVVAKLPTTQPAKK